MVDTDDGQRQGYGYKLPTGELNITRPRGLMLTCERIHLLFDLSCKFKSFLCFSFLNQKGCFCHLTVNLKDNSFEACMTSECSLIFKKYFLKNLMNKI